MSYTGQTLFTCSASDIYTESLSMCGVYDPSVAIQPADQTTCIFSLNLLCKQLVQGGLPLWAVQDVAVPMIGAISTYYIGPSSSAAAQLAAGSGAVNTGNSWTGANGVFGFQTMLRPQRILSAYIRDVNGNDTILAVESRYEYNTNGYKPTQSTPNQLYYDPQLDNGIITVFGTPPDASTTIHLVIQRQIYDINLSTDNPDFPQDAFLMLSWGLADLIAMKYRVKPQDRQEIAMKAALFKEQFFSFQQDYVPIQVVPGDDFSLESMGTSF